MTQVDEQYFGERAVSCGFEAVEHIFEIIKGGTDKPLGYIGGSYAAWMRGWWGIDGDFMPGDVDVFATSVQAAAEIVKRLLAYVWPQEDHVYWLERQNRVAVSLASNVAEHLPVQVIIPPPTWVDFPADILNSFDFDISSAVLMTPETLLAHMNTGCREGKILRIGEPLRTLQRIIKYQNRGVVFSDWEVLKVLKAWDAASPERKKAVEREALDALAAARVDTDQWRYEEDDYWSGE